jgi:hypothetical protein
MNIIELITSLLEEVKSGQVSLTDEVCLTQGNVLRSVSSGEYHNNDDERKTFVALDH